MTMTMPAAAPPRTPQPRSRRRNLQAFLAVLVLIVLLAPVAYLFTKLWSTTSGSAGTTTTERAAVAYARPVNTLLAALVDAGYVGVARRVAAVDSFLPLGPAATQVLVSEDQIAQGARSLLAR